MIYKDLTKPSEEVCPMGFSLRTVSVAEIRNIVIHETTQKWRNSNWVGVPVQLFKEEKTSKVWESGARGDKHCRLKAEKNK